MLDFRLAKWNATAPGLTSEMDWITWLESGFIQATEENIKLSVKKISPMLRRRFTPMGKVAAASLYELDLSENTPLVFASRHGDIELTLSLLQNIAQDQDLSPTNFSLAVHNAIAGLLSIARKDTSTITSITACRDIIPLAILEAITQLQDFEQVVCLICDTPIPDIYKPYTESCEIPYAIAMLLKRSDGTPMRLAQPKDVSIEKSKEILDYYQLLALLLDKQQHATFPTHSASTHWAIQRI
ncbi:beta-ketoacyl synthase chain length factor [Marinomonas posidonica]|uniref:Beta-ketoacyl synthase-like N-terminal domain-containing protein n=1 Tax=Marinomonas posidonica (strain CECT 7376 / NCIMB 14433 / IVIA-Po-181) TaxID=491952 RepID=F6CZV8_MARPP|nr:beta-ketoacyl synthase chain length factor [Marinomonas posidonica]AEF53619.1 hypothetical protein Mar181_0560 [Marinomonas posidonica IVIA-Po-181]